MWVTCDNLLTELTDVQVSKLHSYWMLLLGNYSKYTYSPCCHPTNLEGFKKQLR